MVNCKKKEQCTFSLTCATNPSLSSSHAAAVAALVTVVTVVTVVVVVVVVAVTSARAVRSETSTPAPPMVAVALGTNCKANLARSTE